MREKKKCKKGIAFALAFLFMCGAGAYMGCRTDVSQAEETKEKTISGANIENVVKTQEKESRVSETPNNEEDTEADRHQEEKQRNPESKVSRKAEVSTDTSSNDNAKNNSLSKKGETTTQAHIHSWEPVHETKIVTEEIPIIGDRCNTCGQDITGFAEHHILYGSCTGYSTDVVVGSRSENHEETYISGYMCSCGAVK